MAENPYSRENRITFKPGSIVDGFRIISLLGQGGFGDAYLVKDQKNRIRVKSKLAMKTEYLSAPKQAIIEEVKIINQIHGKCFPQIFFEGHTDSIRYCIMPAYGASIGAVRTERKTLRLSTACAIWIEMLNVIQKLHDQGFVHCDIKPSNFLLQKDSANPLVLIDFGLTIRHIDDKTGKPFPQPESYKFVGTKKYASIHVHQHEGVCRRDDLISWFYSFIEILKGKLPWHAIRDKDEMLEAKLNTSISELITPDLPTKQLRSIWESINSLRYSQKPDYNYILQKMNDIKASDLSSSGVFDWISFYNRINPSDSEYSNQSTEESEDEVLLDPDDHGHCCYVC